MKEEKEKNQNYFAVIMAGGVGSRFWPVSRTSCPKQFRDLLGSGETLIQTTYRRLLALVPKGNIYILTNESYADLIREQLPEVKQEQTVLEPVMRNTAPAVLLAALKIKKKNPKGVMIMAPSDHWIVDEEAFQRDISAGFEACEKQNKIVTLGIHPDFPNTGYGYVEYLKSDHEILKRVKKFTEKPSFEVAKQFLQEGNFLWNAGIFIWNVNFIVGSFRKNMPEMFRILSAGVEFFNTSEERSFIKEHYSRTTDISIDYAILEKEKDTIFVILATFDWNDLGTWGSLYNESEKDPLGNAILHARVLAQNASGNIISTVSNKVVVLDGLRDYIIVDEDEVLLIVPKEKEQEIKEIKARVREKFGNNLE